MQMGNPVDEVSAINPENRFTYNEKEYEEDWMMHNYGFRFYDPSIARWTTVDPLAEQYATMSPYNYVANNPIKFIDPDGMKIIIGFQDENGNKTSVVYGEDGKLYNNDKEGAEYTGDNEYIMTVKNSIDELAAMDGEFGEVINDLITTDEKHSVANYDLNEVYNDIGGSLNVPRTGSKPGTTGSHTRIIPGQTGDFEFTEGLAHELKHGYNKEHGIVSVGTTDNGSRKEEIDAVNFQNAYREKQNKSPRTSYAGRDISKYLGPFKMKKKK